MSRPTKDRYVHSLPKNHRFGPFMELCSPAMRERDFENFKDEEEDNEDTILLTVDEYEVIRLIDHENMTQEEASKKMQVARTTVQSIYAKARKKLAIMLIDGKNIKISGGHYKFCDSSNSCCLEDKK